MKVLLDQNRSINSFGLCETFLNDSIDNEQIHINGFKFERKDKTQLRTPHVKAVELLFMLLNTLIIHDEKK